MYVFSVNKSTTQQLQALVEFMEENAEFARGAPVFGRSKNSVDDMWKNLSTKLNSFGPPSRTIAEWKKTWADLKSRTKKKIAENKKGMEGTGGGLYRVNVLSDMEQIIDRTLFLSAAAAPSGRVFGYENDIDNCFQSLVETPPRGTKAVAVVTPSRQQEDSQQPSCSKQQQPAVSIKTPPTQRYRPPQQSVDEIEGEVPPCSSAKKKEEFAMSRFR